MIETKFGPMARDGDFVLVVDFNYMKRKCETYMARVYRGKAYTGVKIPGTYKYVHKMRAECVIPESYVPQKTRIQIYKDMALHNRDTIEYDTERGILYERDR
jgi:hypothetical protein